MKLKLPIRTKYICDFPNNIRPEVQKGYDLICPKYYNIKIDQVFYGRHKNDNIHCYNKKKKKIFKTDCGYKPIKYVKELCEGKEYCSIVVRDIFFKYNCKGIDKRKISKYLHVDYYCVKDSKLKKPQFSIIQFYNGIKVNSIEENSVNEFYQYSNIHGYDYYFQNFNYNPGRDIYFMKINLIIEYILKGLKERKNGWILYVDNDTFITNPNIKLETFLPNEKMKKVHLIVARDYLQYGGYKGLNAGVYLIEIHEWSLDLFMRVKSYPYYNKKRKIKYSEQSILNNILLEENESDHYVVVPPDWFNSFYGYFISHFMGGNKASNFRKIKNDLKNNPNRYSKTNKQLRKEVLEYYDKPKEEQIEIQI